MSPCFRRNHVALFCCLCKRRSRIETLQVYRQNGITTLAEGIEFDKARQRRQEEVCNCCRGGVYSAAKTRALVLVVASSFSLPRYASFAAARASVPRARLRLCLDKTPWELRRCSFLSACSWPARLRSAAQTCACALCVCVWFLTGKRKGLEYDKKPPEGLLCVDRQEYLERFGALFLVHHAISYQVLKCFVALWLVRRYFSPLALTPSPPSPVVVFLSAPLLAAGFPEAPRVCLVSVRWTRHR